MKGASDEIVAGASTAPLAGQAATLLPDARSRAQTGDLQVQMSKVQVDDLEARLDAKISSRTDALSAQLSTLAEQVGRTETRLEQLLLAVTAQGPRPKVRAAREGPPRERRELAVTSSEAPSARAPLSLREAPSVLALSEVRARVLCSDQDAATPRTAAARPRSRHSHS